MTRPLSRGGAQTAFLIVPYAAWLALMSLLPHTALWYAVRGATTAALLVAFGHAAAIRRPSPAEVRRSLVPGILAGLGVYAVWIAPETLCPALSAHVAASASPYAPAVCGWPLTCVKLAASAFVIPIAEELFFRKWLMDFAGFWWMVALFAVEHGDRWAVGAVAGIAYGLLAKRFGLLSAILAHAVTNFVLGMHVILLDAWRFW